MMKRTLNLIAATTKSHDNARELSVDALKQLAETSVGCPVLVNFDEQQVAGRVVLAEVVYGNLWVHVEIDRAEQYRGAFIVPGFLTLDATSEDGVLRPTKVKAVCYGIVANPVDIGLTPF